MAFLKRFRRAMRAVEVTIGALLIATGVAIFSGALADAAQWLLDTFPVFSRIG
jgi:cytochrome c-type biogenesis protein